MLVPKQQDLSYSTVIYNSESAVALDITLPSTCFAHTNLCYYSAAIAKPLTASPHSSPSSIGHCTSTMDPCGLINDELLSSVTFQVEISERPHNTIIYKSCNRTCPSPAIVPILGDY